MGSSWHFAKAPRNAFEVFAVTLRSEPQVARLMSVVLARVILLSICHGPVSNDGVWACYHIRWMVFASESPLKPVPEAPQQMARCAAPGACIPTTTCLLPRAPEIST